jgi:hypothetical protein
MPKQVPAPEDGYSDEALMELIPALHKLARTKRNKP